MPRTKTSARKYAPAMPNAATINASKTTKAVPKPAAPQPAAQPAAAKPAAKPPVSKAYMSKRSCAICTAKNANGRQCKRWSCAYGPYCWQHTQTKLHLKIADSKVKGAGKGLFAFDPEHKGEKNHIVFAADEKNLPSHPAKGLITPYQISDKYLSKQEIKELKADVLPYALAIHGDKMAEGDYYANPYKTNDGLGRYPNDPGWNSEKGIYDSTAARMRKKKTPINAKLFTAAKKGGDTIPRTRNSNTKIKNSKGKPLATVRQPWVAVNSIKEDIKQGQEIFVKYSKEGSYFTGLVEESESSEEVVPKATKRKAANDRAQRAKKRRQTKK